MHYKLIVHYYMLTPLSESICNSSSLFHSTDERPQENNQKWCLSKEKKCPVKIR